MGKRIRVGPLIFMVAAVMLMWLFPGSVDARGPKVMSDYSGQTYWMVSPPPDLFEGEYHAVTIDLSATGWKEAAFQRVLTITGTVRLRCLIEITEDPATLTSMTFGTTSSPNCLRTSTTLAQLANGTAPVIWKQAQSAAKAGRTADCYTDQIVITSGSAQSENVGYTITGSSATDGTMKFHFWIIATEGSSYADGSGEAN